MPRTTRATYTLDQRNQALELLAQHGTHEASRMTGIPAGTIASWGSRCGVSAPSSEVIAAAVAATVATVEERKVQLAEDLLADAQRLRAQLFAPCVDRRAMAAGAMREVTIVDVELEQPRFVDQRAIMTSIAIAVDKIQILTGAATERIETVTGHTVEDDALETLDELAQRRVA